MVIKEKTKELLLKQLKTCKKKRQNSQTPSKDQTCESWALKKEKRCKQRKCITYSTK
jgi:hypothetical protein